MRTRDELLGKYTGDVSGNSAEWGRKTVEVLLDIREILIEELCMEKGKYPSTPVSEKNSVEEDRFAQQKLPDPNAPYQNQQINSTPTYQ